MFQTESTLNQFPILGFNSKVICEWHFLKIGDRDGFSLVIGHIFFWVSKEKKELSPSQIIYEKLEKHLSLSIYKSIYFIHKVSFFQREIIAIYLWRRANIDLFSETDN